MMTFKEYSEMEEGSGLEFLSTFVPTALMNVIKKSVNKDKYIKAADLYRDITKDKSRNVSKNLAIKKVADLVGLNIKDLTKVLAGA
jgi:hypothetical protein